MKVEELISILSIGDWVLFPHGYDRVWGIYEMDYDLCVDFLLDQALVPCSIEEIQPIPLTSEILESNGFEKLQDDSYVLTVEKQMAGDGFEVQRVTIHNMKTMVIETAEGKLQFPVKYLNQLQHALKLAGVEKEFVL